MAEQRAFVDYEQGLGDTGQDNVDAIQPITTGEGATETVFRRPSENIRARTEIVRDVVSELLQYRDYGHMMLEYTGGTSIKWEGAAPGAPPLGRITVTGGGLIKISPFLAPKTAQKGSLSVGTATVDQITYSVAAAAYATQGLNAVTVAHTDGGAATVLNVSITDGPVKRIIVLFDSTNTAHDAATVKTAVDAAIAGDADLIGLITTSTNAVAANTIAALAETRLEGTADDESHVITAADLQTLTTTTPLQTGMGIAVWYRYLIEPTGGDPGDPKVGLAGGRSESSVNRGTSAIPAASLFITDSDPEKIPGAIPVCRVGYGGQLIWADGTRQQAGETVTFASATSVASAALAAHVATLAGLGGAAIVGYGGSGNWVDGSSVASGTVEAAIDEVVSDLASNTGAAKVGVNGATLFTAATLTSVGGGGAGNTTDDIAEALDNLDANVVRRRAFTAVATDGTNSTGGDVNATDISSLLTTFADGGEFYLRRGTYTIDPAANFNKPLHLIAEPQGTITNEYTKVTQVRVGDFGLDITNGVDGVGNRFKGLDFHVTASTANQWEFENGVHVIEHCRASAGVLGFKTPGGSGAQIVDIDGLLIDNDTDASANIEGMRFTGSSTFTITGKIKDLYVSGVPAAGAGAKTVLSLTSLDPIGTGNGLRNSLVFESCSLQAIFGGFAGGGDVLGISDCSQPTTFKGCYFRAAAAGVIVARLGSAENVTFEDCVFEQASTGKVLEITTSNNILFRNCRFYTSTTTINAGEFYVSVGPAERGAVRFENCFLEVRAGSNVTSRRLLFNYDTAGTEVGEGPIEIDGLKIKLTYADPGLNSRLLMIGAGITSVRHATYVNNLHIDLNSKQLDASTSAMVFGGDIAVSKGWVTVSNLSIVNARSPSAGAGTSYLVNLQRATINMGFIEANPGGTEVDFDAVIALRDRGASVNLVQLYTTGSSPLLGTQFSMASTQTNVSNCTIHPVVLPAAVTANSWILKMTEDTCVFANNRVRITAASGLAAGSYLMSLTEADLCTLTGNTITCLEDENIRSLNINSTSDHNAVAGNVFTGNRSAPNWTAIKVDGNYNSVSANVLYNVDLVFVAEILTPGTGNEITGDNAID